MSKLLCVLIDGLRTDAMACAHLRCFDRIAREGLVRGIEQLPPCLPLPTLVSLFTSQLPEEHGVLSNNGDFRIAPRAVSLFSLLRYRHQNLSALYSSDNIRLLFPLGCLQTGMFINSQGIRNVDRELAQLAGRHLQKEQPDFCLLQLQGVAICGTHFGFHSEPYLESIEQADQSLELVLEHLALVGLLQDYTIMVLSSHDGHRQPVSSTRTPSLLPLLCSGPGIVHDPDRDQSVSLLDLAPTMARMLGLAPHPDWQGDAVEAMLRQPVLELIAQEREITTWQASRHQDLVD
ncbi:alkaline phosphatase family protein [Desulfobulbus alkaliphilus]|uniref:alkaline phosphatase family protein n=1 Tax=Desulfobulbus alkaliphilus TaxID=869814 RepID=UPI001966BF21|nr:alkaline phosphatase family protein [Desulfobulbus alkaliphilus]MBM9536101.1 alkaline phosphatase family protein [Desulfobulbus alkaliphilus]